MGTGSVWPRGRRISMNVLPPDITEAHGVSLRKNDRVRVEIRRPVGRRMAPSDPA